MTRDERSSSNGSNLSRVPGPTGSLGWVGLAAYAVAMLLLLVVVVERLVWQIPVGDSTRDPATVAGTHPFVGWLSNVGVLVWGATASICLFTAAVLRRRGDPLGNARS